MASSQVVSVFFVFLIGLKILWFWKGGAVISVSTCSRRSLAPVFQDIAMFLTEMEMPLGWAKPYPRTPCVVGLASTCAPVRAPHSRHPAVKWVVCLCLRQRIDKWKPSRGDDLRLRTGHVMPWATCASGSHYGLGLSSGYQGQLHL